VEYGAELRRRVGVVFQRPERQLFEETVYKDVSFALRRADGMSEEDIGRRVRDVCSLLGLDMDSIADRPPLALSDAEKRKTAIAGILVNDPEVVVLDEPAVGLDPPSARDLVELLAELKTTRGKTLVIVSHDMDRFLPLLDTLVVLWNGRVEAVGTPEEVCDHLHGKADRKDLIPRVAALAHLLREAGFRIPKGEFRVREMVEHLEHRSWTQEDRNRLWSLIRPLLSWDPENVIVTTMGEE
jgi:energy-coupling factor transport system ATP-binding protein